MKKLGIALFAVVIVTLGALAVHAATVYGVNATKAYNSTPATKIDAAVDGGKVRLLYDSYEAAATASGTIIELFGNRLPDGARILPDTEIWCDDLGTSASLTLRTVDIADGDTNTILTVADAHTAAVLTAGNAIGNINTFPVEITESEKIQLVTGGGAAATGTIKVYLRYTLD
jgi:hypothetical protein